MTIAQPLRPEKGKPWRAEKHNDGISLVLAHPGGGTYNLKLGRDAIDVLIEDLKESIS